MPADRPPETVLFDLDGTLVDNFDAISTAANHVLEVMGFAPLPREVICNSVGGGALGTMARLVGKENAPTATSLYLEHFPSVMFEGLRVYPGAREILRALRARGTVVAVLTNKDHTNALRILAHLGMDKDLDGIFGTNAVPWRKPDPAFTTYALGKLGNRTAAAAEMIGDSPYDIATARQGGLSAARVVATGTHSLEELAKDRPDSGHPDLPTLAREAWGMGI